MSTFITLVSGLPRSGTSMMMRMLEAGGIPPMTDEVREADVDNPNGYYEFERIKKVKKDASWMEDARGKAIKAIYMLLYDLPAEYSYKVVFMMRNLDEIVASQDAMLRRLDPDANGMESGLLRKLFTSHLDKVIAWLATQAHFDTLYVRYNDILVNPTANVRRINQFLGGGLDEEAMAAVVDPDLYRQKA